MASMFNFISNSKGQGVSIKVVIKFFQGKFIRWIIKKKKMNDYRTAF